jgi:NAD(P)-dependent dehydrogenase (short-subunit alcohol dehydrogenase family)
MQRLNGRVAVVTGAANGIGFGLARRFLAEGMKVVAADLNAEDLDRAVAELGAAGGEVLGVRTDVSDAASVQALADAAVARFGAAHVLCNNAGVGGFQRFGSTSLDTWRWIMGVNIWGPIHGCQAFLPILEAQDEAHIVNTASMAGFIYAPYNAPYNVTKAGVVALTEGLYREFATEKPHIGLSVLCPAFTATRIGDDERNAPAAHARRVDTDPDLEPMRQELNANLAAGKAPDEVADQVVRGIRARTLHIFTHPEWLGVIETRAQNILAGRPVDSRFNGELLDR